MIKFIRITFIIGACCCFLEGASQDGVGIGTATPDITAVLDVKSDSKGMLIPRLTTQNRLNISTPPDGLIVYDIDVSAVMFATGGIWERVGVPQGTIVMWSGNTPPEGWALCDGTNGTPNLRGRFIVGLDNSNSDYAQTKNTGGLPKTTLDVTNLPSHSHSISNHSHTLDLLTSSTGEHMHGMTLHGASGSDYFRVVSGSAGSPRLTLRSWTRSHETSNSDAETTIDGEDTYTGHGDNSPDGDQQTNADIKPTGQHRHHLAGSTSSASLLASATGGGGAFENRPPYYVLAFIIKK